MASPENLPDISTGPTAGHATPGSPLIPPPEQSRVERTEARQSWQVRLLGISFAIFAFEIGLCLVFFPWTERTWDINYFQTAAPALRNFWEDPYFRGAISGLGLVNIYIALFEVGRLMRRASPR